MKYCQFNEEVLLERILKKIGTTNKIAIEFGCYPDNIERDSNTEHLKSLGWTVKQLNEFFTAENVNHIFNKREIPNSPDFMSIDIDGMDYYIWQAMKRVKPRIICIEYNFCREKGVEPYNPNNKWNEAQDGLWGSSKEEMIKLGIEKGYVKVAENRLNLFFIKKEDYETKY